MIKYLTLIIGFFILIKGADIFVDSAKEIARKFNIPSLVIGLTIVAFGTSVPEAAVGISAAVNSANGIVLGNVIGSNIFNILCAAGITAVLNPIKIQNTTITKEFPLVIFSTVVLFILSIDNFFMPNTVNTLITQDGIILIMIFGIFLYYITELAFSNKSNEDISLENTQISLSINILKSIVGILFIILGGNAVVNSAKNIASSLGMSQELIGLTIVAIGTSLPELITSIVAAKKGESDIAIGNIIGSCLFNILFILGISAVINPIEVSANIIIDTLVLISILTITYLFSVTKREINKKEGYIMFIIYVFYTIFIIIRK